jgi:hypothetical protein
MIKEVAGKRRDGCYPVIPGLSGPSVAARACGDGPDKPGHVVEVTMAAILAPMEQIPTCPPGPGGHPSESYRNPIEIQGMAATTAIPTSRAATYGMIGFNPSFGWMRLTAHAA